MCHSYFSSRTAKFEIAGVKVVKNVTRGCPQGSACGPSFWNILYDEVFELRLPANCELVAFADDLLLMSWASDLPALEEQTNTAIKLIADWGQGVKLSFNETKTKVMVIHSKRATQDLHLSMNGSRLELVDSFRYLGIIIDNKLKWKLHLKHVQSKAMKLSTWLTRLARNTWGLNSDVTYDIYKLALEPLVLYGAEVWHSALKYKWAADILNQIQRSFLLRICKGYRTLSFDALCIITNIPPITEKVKEFPRLREAKTKGELSLNMSKLQVEVPTKPLRHPALSIESFVHLTEASNNDDPVLKIYTDGSKTDDGVGCAFVVYKNGEEISSQHYRLPNYSTVFQAELIAIKVSLEYLTDHSVLPTSVTLHTDSQSSLQAIRDRENRSPIVNDIQNLLFHFKLMTTSISLYWTRAHVGTTGNERADQLAKSFLLQSSIFYPLNAPKSYIKRKLRIDTLNTWNRIWSLSEKGSWTRKIFPSVEQRQKIGKIKHNFIRTQFLSNHGKFGAYLHRFRIRRYPDCICGEEQDCEHLLFRCLHTRDTTLKLEHDCIQRGLDYTPESIGILLSNEKSAFNLDSILYQIHNTLVMWERSI